MAADDTAAKDDFPEHSTALAAACLYASRGWRVLPLKGKAPRTPHGFKDATTNLDTIRRCWQRSPEAGVGIATGSESGIVALDIDARHGGLESLAQLEEEHGSLPETTKVKTGDGFHFYFIHPGGHVPCRANIRPGIDLKADGGYVVAPPSLHPNGARYQFASDPGHLADAPLWLVHVIQPAKPNGAQAHSGPATLNLDGLRISDALKKTIREGRPKGQRSDAIYAVERALIKAGYDDETICAVLLNPNHGLSEKPLEQGRAWLMSDIKRARSKPDRQHKATTQSARPLSGLTAITAKQLNEKQFPPQQWAVCGLLPQGLAILAGAPKMGKSWMALGIAVAVALGRTALLGFQTKMAGVLYLAFEDSERRIQDRLCKLASDDVPENLYFVTSCPPMHQGGLDHLDVWLSCHPEVKMVFVDTFGRFRPPQKSGANVYLDDYSVGAQLKALGDKHSAVIVVICHTRKAPADDPLDEVSGSKGLTAAADTIWVLKRPKRTSADTVLFVTGRDIEERELALKFDPQTGKYTTIGDAGDLARSQIRNKILEVLRNKGRPMTPTEVAASLNKEINTVKQRMYQMMKDGELRQPERGKYIPA